MRPTILAVTLAALSFHYWPATPSAQEERTVRGVITEIGGNFVTAKVGGESMTFGADSKTQIENRGAGTKSRQIVATGKPGPHLSDVLTIGLPVAVTYRDAAGKPYASFIRAVPRAPSGGAVDAASGMRSTGTVKAIGGDSLTIVGASGGGGSFTQTFHVSSTTKVIGKGIGTATAAQGGKAAFSDLIATGDRVSVSYRKVGDALQASDVRVMMKGSGSH